MQASPGFVDLHSVVEKNDLESLLCAVEGRKVNVVNGKL